MLLEVQQIQKQFDGIVALNNVSFDVNEGEILGIMGANGAGKTTLFSLIAGHAKPSSGNIRFSGTDITGKRPDLVCALGISRTYQIVRPFKGLTVQENVATGILYGSRRESSVTVAGEKAREILQDVGLADRANDLASTLTLAGSKRLELAKALATGPKILLLDEVMAGLTPSEVGQAIEIIETCRTKYAMTIIVIEHVMKALMHLCHRIVVLHHGDLIAEGPPEEIAINEQVIQAYLGQE